METSAPQAVETEVDVEVGGSDGPMVKQLVLESTNVCCDSRHPEMR